MAAVILLLGGETPQTYAQRCGGDVTCVLRNRKGETLMRRRLKYSTYEESLIARENLLLGKEIR